MFSGRELDVMSALWELGSGTVSDVLATLSDDLAYTTVLTILQRLEKKGRVRREPEGQAHRYFPAVAREVAQDSAIRRLTKKLFSDSPELLMSRLVNRGGLSAEQLKELRDLLDERLKERGDP